MRETHVRQFSGELTIVPNSTMFKNPVLILTDEPMRRSETVVGVSYDSDLEAAEDIIRKAVESVEIVEHAKPILVCAQTFNSSSVDFLVQWWCNTAEHDIRVTKGVVMKAVKAALDDAGIEIPFPYVTNTFKEPLALSRAPQEDAA